MQTLLVGHRDSFTAISCLCSHRSSLLTPNLQPSLFLPISSRRSSRFFPSWFTRHALARTAGSERLLRVNTKWGHLQLSFPRQWNTAELPREFVWRVERMSGWCARSGTRCAPVKFFADFWTGSENTKAKSLSRDGNVASREPVQCHNNSELRISSERSDPSVNTIDLNAMSINFHSKKKKGKFSLWFTC